MIQAFLAYSDAAYHSNLYLSQAPTPFFNPTGTNSLSGYVPVFFWKNHDLTQPHHACTRGDSVTDPKTGLEWKCAHEGEHANPLGDSKFVDVEFAGHKDWRMATIDELKTLIHAAAEVTSKLDDHRQGLFWSSSPYSGGTGYAWYVSFGYSCADGGYRSYPGYVRLVRASQ
jgi:hypothetical protein